MNLPNEEIAHLEQQVRQLERENRTLKRALIDDYTAAALTGLLAHGWGPDDLVATRAVEIARLTLKARQL